MTLATPAARPRRWPVITTLGIVEIFAWGSSYYLMAPLAGPIVAETGWPLPWVIGALSLGLLVAGFASPHVGAAIARHGGRPVLAAGMLLLAAGLLLLAVAPSLPAFYAGWIVIGLGMSAGLYDPCFATLGRLYRRDARSAITALTLWGGFASTICWPLSTWGLAHLGWRGTVVAYAGLHLCLTLPLILAGLPKEPANVETVRARNGAPVELADHERLAYALMAAAFTLAASISSIMAVHLITLLQGLGISAIAAVTLGTLIGPAQVAARVVEMASVGRHHPRWTLLIAAGLFGSGLLLLASGKGGTGLALALYGAGNGLFSIARGALPMTLFGPERHAVLIGRMARPSLIAQAFAPMAGAVLLDTTDGSGALAVLAAAGIVAVGLTAWLVADGVRGRSS